MSTTVKSLAFAAAALISTTAAVGSAHANEEVKGKCHGVNACKGKTACATAESACAGTNSCKGKGWLPMTEAECKEKEGKFELPKR